MKAVIDTNVVIELLKRKPNLTVIRNASAYRRSGNKFLMNLIVYFEYRRGILAAGQDRDGRARAFDRFVANECEWIELDKRVAQKGAWLWSVYSGMRVPDADMLIAAGALVYGTAVATRNRSHIGRFGVEVWDWFEERPKAVRTRRVR